MLSQTWPKAIALKNLGQASEESNLHIFLTILFPCLQYHLQRGKTFGATWHSQNFPSPAVCLIISDCFPSQNSSKVLQNLIFYQLSPK